MIKYYTKHPASSKIKLGCFVSRIGDLYIYKYEFKELYELDNDHPLMMVVEKKDSKWGCIPLDVNECEL